MFNSKWDNYGIQVINPISEKFVGVNNIPFDSKFIFLRAHSNYPEF